MLGHSSELDDTRLIAIFDTRDTMRHLLDFKAGRKYATMWAADLVARLHYIPPRITLLPQCRAPLRGCLFTLAADDDAFCKDCKDILLDSHTITTIGIRANLLYWDCNPNGRRFPYPKLYEKEAGRR